jgi:hypothetical protein
MAPESSSLLSQAAATRPYPKPELFLGGGLLIMKAFPEVLAVQNSDCTVMKTKCFFVFYACK